MKLICLAFLLVLTVCNVLVDVNASSCLGLNDFTNCKWSECCAKKIFPKTGFECKSKGDKVDDRCGGEYTCGCNANLNCVPDSGILKVFKQGTGSCKRVGFIQG